MKAGDAKGVPVQMKWLNASEVWKPAPRLKIDSPGSGTNAAVKTRPRTSDRPYAAFEITIPPYECPTRIFGPGTLSSTARPDNRDVSGDRQQAEGRDHGGIAVLLERRDDRVPALGRRPGAMDEG